ncbi:L,D-transpeptidase [Nitratireductor luteus]|uniref:L,D-transpeptidase n=1 Tax=Nitratireductor luteus TaxID=2976980 RepID=UPI0022405B43|nr:L,D-transpeptidase [Nitratireductor luteus]
MKPFLCAAGLVAVLLSPWGAQAQNRYVERPPVLVSPDLSAPWVMQLRSVPAEAQARYRARQAEQYGRYEESQRQMQRRVPVAQPRQVERQRAFPPAPQRLHTAAVAPRAPQQPDGRPDSRLDPKFLPQEVNYDGPHKPGTIVVDTGQRFLYLVQPGGKARRYGVGVGKEGFSWSGTEKISQKREWPDWRPPAEMIAREKKKGRILPAHMKGGPSNPLGARALYLGSTLYRIHGTNAPWTIGRAVSSGCIRMRNEDVTDLYNRVQVGTKVVVI